MESHFTYKMIKLTTIGVLATVLSHTAYAVADKTTETKPTVTTNDPLEGFNRVMFQFNERVDQFVLKPVATAYNAVLPKPVNQGIHNVFLNINNLPSIANDILQLNVYYAANDFWRLLINTTLGVGGLFDIAWRMQLKPHATDFGLTLAKWGYHQSTYLVLPFLGPSSIRDTIGFGVDYYGFSIYPRIHPDRTRYALYGLSIIDRRAQLLQFQSVMEEAALDKYVFVRDAYVQRRTHQQAETISFDTENQMETSNSH